jgi:DNA-3-methyladenine glycosylase
MGSKRLLPDFFRCEVLEVAPQLLGKTLVRSFNDGTQYRCTISETEAYRGVDDLACHASKGITPRTEVMFRDGGVVYVYLIYGIYWMLNIVTGTEGDASAVLIRGVDNIYGPGRVGRLLEIDDSFYAEDLHISDRIWVENSASGEVSYDCFPRVGIAYAGEPWVSMPWRYRIKTVTSQ